MKANNKMRAAIQWKGYSAMQVEPLELNAEVFTFKVNHENEDYLQMVDIFVAEKASMTFHDGCVMVCVLRKDLDSIIMY